MLRLLALMLGPVILAVLVTYVAVVWFVSWMLGEL